MKAITVLVLAIVAGPASITYWYADDQGAVVHVAPLVEENALVESFAIGYGLASSAIRAEGSAEGDTCRELCYIGGNLVLDAVTVRHDGATAGASTLTMELRWIPGEESWRLRVDLAGTSEETLFPPEGDAGRVTLDLLDQGLDLVWTAGEHAQAATLAREAVEEHREDWPIAVCTALEIDALLRDVAGCDSDEARTERLIALLLTAQSS